MQRSHFRYSTPLAGLLLLALALRTASGQDYSPARQPKLGDLGQWNGAVALRAALGPLGYNARRIGNAIGERSSFPFDETALTNRAIEEIERKNYDCAAFLLKEAIESNGDDLGAKYDAHELIRSESKSFDEGETQMTLMIGDRPAMQGDLTRDADIWIWTAKKFATKVNDARIEWDPSDTSGPDVVAQHSIPHRSSSGKLVPGKIKVKGVKINGAASEADRREQSERAFEQLWCGAVFELHNIELASDFLALNAKARQGIISEAEFVKAMFCIEMKAVQRTRMWYVQVYLPHAKSYGLSTDPNVWFCDRWGSPEYVFRRYQDRTQYPWVPYAGYYARYHE